MWRQARQHQRGRGRRSPPGTAVTVHAGRDQPRAPADSPDRTSAACPRPRPTRPRRPAADSARGCPGSAASSLCSCSASSSRLGCRRRGSAAATSRGCPRRARDRRRPSASNGPATRDVARGCRSAWKRSQDPRSEARRSEAPGLRRGRFARSTIRRRNVVDMRSSRHPKRLPPPSLASATALAGAVVRHSFSACALAGCSRAPAHRRKRCRAPTPRTPPRSRVPTRPSVHRRPAAAVGRRNAPTRRSRCWPRSRLALGPARRLTLDVADTGGTPSGASAGGRPTRSRGTTPLILGPLKSRRDTARQPPIATPAPAFPILAWTSDTAVAGPRRVGARPHARRSRWSAWSRRRGRRGTASSFAAFLPDGRVRRRDGRPRWHRVARPRRPGIRPRSRGTGRISPSINDGPQDRSSGFDEPGRRSRQAVIKADRAQHADPAVSTRKPTQLAAQPVPARRRSTRSCWPTPARRLCEEIHRTSRSLRPSRRPACASWDRRCGDNFARKLGADRRRLVCTRRRTLPTRAGFVARILAPGITSRHQRGLEDHRLRHRQRSPRPSRRTTGDFSSGLEPRAARTGSPAPTACSSSCRTDGCGARYAVFQIDDGGGSHIVSPAPSRLAATAGCLTRSDPAAHGAARGVA